eukprot:gene2129-3065_t
MADNAVYLLVAVFAIGVCCCLFVAALFLLLFMRARQPHSHRTVYRSLPPPAPSPSPSPVVNIVEPEQMVPEWDSHLKFVPYRQGPLDHPPMHHAASETFWGAYSDLDLQDQAAMSARDIMFARPPI